ncbi:J domain-containing protein [Chloropicon roscoffensis]|uniref:J domain-containing protein n=1 Tax=Chloropicon roscoffensis TaxID=1461544 RepID=A0AAX4P785_9CHLO
MESVARGVLGKHRENRRDPFHVLGNPRNLKDARQSFRKLALLLHPDKCGNEAHRSLCEEAFKVVNNAFKKIEAEYGEQSVGAEAEVFQRRQEPAAVSRTDVEAARSNWRTGQRGGDPEDSFKRGRGDAVDPDIRSSGPYFGCAAAQEPSASSPARASARVIPRWNKENFGPVSADQVKAARKNWGEPSTSSSSGLHFECSLSPSLNCTPLGEADYDTLREEDMEQKRKIAKAQAAKIIKEGKVRGIWAQNRQRKRKKRAK